MRRCSLIPFFGLVFGLLPVAHADDLVTLNNGTTTITFQVGALSPCTTISYYCSADAAAQNITINGVSQGDGYASFYDEPAGGLALSTANTLLVDDDGAELVNCTSVDDSSLYPVCNGPDELLLGSFGIFELNGQDIYQSDWNGTVEPYMAPSSITPEPGSFALFGTGLLGVVGVLKRRSA